MPITPIQAAAQALAAAPVAERAVSRLSSGFAGLLKLVVVGPNSGSHSDGSPGLQELINGSRAASAGIAARPLGSLEARTDALLGQFHRLLSGLLTDHGVGTGAGIRLAPDGTGQVRVAGPHRDGSLIESLVNGSPELRGLFQRVLANAALLRSARPDRFAVLVDSQRASLVFE